MQKRIFPESIDTGKQKRYPDSMLIVYESEIRMYLTVCHCPAVECDRLQLPPILGLWMKSIMTLSLDSKTEQETRN